RRGRPGGAARGTPEARSASARKPSRHDPDRHDRASPVNRPRPLVAGHGCGRTLIRGGGGGPRPRGESSHPPATPPPPRPRPDHLAAGRTSLEAREYTAAIKAFTLALKGDPKAVDAYRGRARAYLGRGKIRKALADLDQLVKLEPKSPANLLERGQVHAASGNH